MFFKIGALKNFAIEKFAQENTGVGVCFKNTFFYRAPPVTAGVCFNNTFFYRAPPVTASVYCTLTQLAQEMTRRYLPC